MSRPKGARRLPNFNLTKVAHIVGINMGLMQKHNISLEEVGKKTGGMLRNYKEE